MPIIETGAAALGALKTAYDLVRAVRNSEDVAELKATIDELATRLVDARADVMQMQEDMIALKRRAEVAEEAANKRTSFQETAAKYVQQTLANGAVVFRLRNPEPGNPVNYCPTCMGNEKIAVMQPTIIPGVIRCNTCKGAAGRH